jgi:uncharacterized protein (TIGR02001 family)
MLKKTLISGLLATASSLGTVQSFAQNAPAAAAPTPPYTLTGNVGLFSQYIFRGLTQTNRDPALQGGFDFGHSSGLYLGTWASNISWLRDPKPAPYSGGGSLEWDFYGGFKNNIGTSDFTYDVGLLYYYYPGSVAPSFVKADTFEGYGALGWKFVTAKFSYSLDSKTFGVTSSRGTWYFDLSADIPLGETGLTANLHYGKQKYDGTAAGSTFSNNTLYSYSDYKIGLSYALPKDFTVGAFYSDTHGANRLGYGSVSEGGVFPHNIAKSAFTGFIKKTF